MLIKRNENTEIQKKDSEFIKKLSNKENLDVKDTKKFV